MQPDLDDIGGAKELALHRINVAKDDLEAAKMSFMGLIIMGGYICRGIL